MERNIELPPEMLQHVADMALEIATRGVWKLRSDTNSKETLPDELWEILRRRLYLEANEYRLLIQIVIQQNFQKPDPWITEFLSGDWASSILPGEDTPLLRRVYAVFLRQLEEYRKKHGERISETIQKAKGSDVPAMCRAICLLIEWDSLFRGIDFIRTEIEVRSALQSEKDRAFLKRVAEAEGKRPAIKRHAADSGFWTLCKLFVNRYDVSGRDNSNLKRLHSMLSNSGAFVRDAEDVKENNPLFDYKYFVRYLKRRNFIP